MANLFTYNGKSCDMNCHKCETCIFDKDDFNNDKKMNKQNDLTKITSCNECPHSICKEASCSHGELNNWYCNTKNVKRIIDMSVLSTATLEIPSWCPMGLHKNKQSEEQSLTSKKILSYMEKKNLWESITQICKWEDIKVDDIYHVPPVMNDERRDILITNITDFSFQYKKIEKNKKSSCSAIYTVYKTALWWKFMSKSKLIKIKVVK